jgi:hypothetical protein
LLTLASFGSPPVKNLSNSKWGMISEKPAQFLLSETRNHHTEPQNPHPDVQEECLRRAATPRRAIGSHSLCSIRRQLDNVSNRLRAAVKQHASLRRPTQGRWIPVGAAAPRAMNSFPMVAGINRRKNVPNRLRGAMERHAARTNPSTGGNFFKKSRLASLLLEKNRFCTKINSVLLCQQEISGDIDYVKNQSTCFFVRSHRSHAEFRTSVTGLSEGKGLCQ